jgi:hypothetical protein
MPAMKAQNVAWRTAGSPVLCMHDLPMPLLDDAVFTFSPFDAM